MIWLAKKLLLGKLCLLEFKKIDQFLFFLYIEKSYNVIGRLSIRTKRKILTLHLTKISPVKITSSSPPPKKLTCNN